MSDLVGAAGLGGGAVADGYGTGLGSQAKGPNGGSLTSQSSLLYTATKECSCPVPTWSPSTGS